MAYLCTKWYPDPARHFAIIDTGQKGATENASTENASTGEWNTQVRKTQVRMCRGGKRKYGNVKNKIICEWTCSNNK